VGAYRVPGSPIDSSLLPRLPPTPAPLLGQHTDEILATVLGLSDAEIGTFHDAGVVAGPTGHDA
jgi:2-methylfumaryl-CoA isomerase